MKFTEKIRREADRKVKYMSAAYLRLPKTAQRFAEPHILHHGFYSFTLTNGKKSEKVLVVR